MKTKQGTRIKLERLEAGLKKYHAAMRAALEKQYPIGSQVMVLLRHGQRIPSRGEVIYHDGDGCLRVRLNKTGTAKTVHFRCVVDI